MIKVHFNSKDYKLSISGHANYAEEGKDIVCAAVSILFYTLAASLEENMLKAPVEKEIGKGSSAIQCTPKPEYEGNVGLIYWQALNGFQLMADAYPDHVKLIVK